MDFSDGFSNRAIFFKSILLIASNIAAFITPIGALAGIMWMSLLKSYDVKLVPTCVFKNADGNVIRKTEGNIQARILENYMKEQLNG